MNDQNGDQNPGRTADVGEQRVAKVYAEALLDSAERHDQATEILHELEELIVQVFREEPQFEEFLASGAISREHKTQVLRSVFADRTSELLYHFLLVLNEHERLGLLRAIVAAYHTLSDERSGRIRVSVRSAVPLPDDQQVHLVQELRNTFQREPLLETHVDPELLGGLIVQVGDWLYDGSVRTKIDNLRKEIMERSSYEIQSRRDHFCSTNGD